MVASIEQLLVKRKDVIREYRQSVNVVGLAALNNTDRGESIRLENKLIATQNI